MVTDLIGGQVEMGALALPAIQAHLKSGALRAIGVGGAHALAGGAGHPDDRRARLAELRRRGWFARGRPAKLSAADVKRMHEAFVAAFARPRSRRRWPSRAT